MAQVEIEHDLSGLVPTDRTPRPNPRARKADTYAEFQDRMMSKPASGFAGRRPNVHKPGSGSEEWFNIGDCGGLPKREKILYDPDGRPYRGNYKPTELGNYTPTHFHRRLSGATVKGGSILAHFADIQDQCCGPGGTSAMWDFVKKEQPSKHPSWLDQDTAVEHRSSKRKEKSMQEYDAYVAQSANMLPLAYQAEQTRGGGKKETQKTRDFIAECRAAAKQLQKTGSKKDKKRLAKAAAMESQVQPQNPLPGAAGAIFPTWLNGKASREVAAAAAAGAAPIRPLAAPEATRHLGAGAVQSLRGVTRIEDLPKHAPFHLKQKLLAAAQSMRAPAAPAAAPARKRQRVPEADCGGGGAAEC